MEDLERLSEDGAELLGVERRQSECEAWIWYAPSGGSVSPELVTEIKDGLTAIAKLHGYPERASERAKAAFDIEAAKWLATHRQSASPEFLRDDVWAFLSCVILQELVIWRYSARQRARFAGGVRNTFQRLWMRGRTLVQGEAAGAERWKLLEDLSEDAMVQIFERASIASDATLARAIATGWVATSDRIGRARMEDVMRRATKLLRLRNQVMDLTFLGHDELKKEVDCAFSQSSEDLAADDNSHNQHFPRRNINGIFRDIARKIRK
ncbi:MAG: DUF6339 family protein [Roseibium sp.]